MNREHELNIMTDMDGGFSRKELQDIGSATMRAKLQRWLDKREPSQWTFRNQINADCSPRRKKG